MEPDGTHKMFLTSTILMEPTKCDCRGTQYLVLVTNWGLSNIESHDRAYQILVFMKEFTTVSSHSGTNIMLGIIVGPILLLVINGK